MGPKQKSAASTAPVARGTARVASPGLEPVSGTPERMGHDAPDRLRAVARYLKERQDAVETGQPPSRGAPRHEERLAGFTPFEIVALRSHFGPEIERERENGAQPPPGSLSAAYFYARTRLVDVPPARILSSAHPPKSALSVAPPRTRPPTYQDRHVTWNDTATEFPVPPPAPGAGRPPHPYRADQRGARGQTQERMTVRDAAREAARAAGLAVEHAVRAHAALAGVPQASPVHAACAKMAQLADERAAAARQTAREATVLLRRELKAQGAAQPAQPTPSQGPAPKSRVHGPTAMGAG